MACAGQAHLATVNPYGLQLVLELAGSKHGRISTWKTMHRYVEPTGRYQIRLHATYERIKK
jgi:hypothetical protein